MHKSEEHFVTIVLAVYNEEKTVEHCLKSLINQNYKNKEIIVIDDGSTDKSWEKISRLAKQESIVKTIKIDHHGCAHARKVGVEAAHGSIIAIAEADAVYDVNWLKHGLTHLTDPNVGGVFGPHYVLHPDTWVLRSLDVWWKIRFGGQYKPFGAYVFRKSVINEAGGFDPQLQYAEDVDLGMRITKLGYKFVYEPKAIFWHQEPSTIKEFVRQGFHQGKHYVRFCVKHPNRTPYFRLGLSALFLVVLFMSLFDKLYLQLLCLFTVFIFVSYSFRMFKKGWRAANKRRYLFTLSLLGLLKHVFFMIGFAYGSFNYLLRPLRSKTISD